MVIKVLFVLLPNTLMLDVAGPAEVLRLASQMQPEGVFTLSYCGPVARVHTSIGLPLEGISALPAAVDDGTVVILVGTSQHDTHPPGESAAAEQAVVRWLREVVAPAGNTVMCVCAGALLAARAGLLDGRQCTTHHALCAELQGLAPQARVLENRLYVCDGHISTSAGITAGIDLALHWLAQVAGAQLACAVAREMVIYLRRNGHDAQLSPWIAGRNHLHPALHRVQDAVSAAPTDAWSVERMAQIACTSTRHLGRLFHEHIAMSPLDYLHRLRVARARDLITQSSLDMESIAQQSGFGSARHMRRVWHKFDTTLPSQSRSPLKA